MESVAIQSSRIGGRVAMLAMVGLAVLALALGSLALRPTNQVFDQPITEDGFYSLSVARNIAEGNGVTIDGKTLTNGFQPLFTIVTVPLFLVAGDNTALAIRLLLLLQVIVLLATGLVLGLVVADALGNLGLDRRSVIGLTALAYSSASLAITTGLNGLETGFLLLMYAVIWRVYQVRGVKSIRDAALLGVLLGALVLTRIDATVFVAVVCVSVALERSKGALARAAVAGGAAALVSAPWWLYNWLQFSSIMPSSGKAEQLWGFSGDRVTALFGALVDAGVPWLHLSRFAGVAASFVRLVPIVAGVLAWRWLRRRDADAGVMSEHPASERAARTTRFALMLGATTGLLSIWYLFSSGASFFYGRYLSLLMLVAVFGWIWLALLIWARWPGIAAGTFAVLLGAGLAVVFGLSSPVLLSGNEMYRDQVPLVRRYVPPGSVVAAEQTGTLGFFRDRVLNLDGKVNAEALRHRNDMNVYLRSLGVHWVCDWPGMLARVFKNYRADGWTAVGHKGQFVCIKRE